MLAPVARLLVPLAIGLFADLAAPALILRSVWVAHPDAFEVDAAMWAGCLLRRRACSRASSRASSRAPLVLAATKPCWNRRPRPHFGHTPRLGPLGRLAGGRAPNRNPVRRCFGWGLRQLRLGFGWVLRLGAERFGFGAGLGLGLVSGAGGAGVRHKTNAGGAAVPSKIVGLEPLSSCSTKTRINDKEHMH